MMDIEYTCAECWESESAHSNETAHEFERGCYCGERGRCDVCVDKAIDYADYLRDSAKESY